MRILKPNLKYFTNIWQHFSFYGILLWSQEVCAKIVPNSSGANIEPLCRLCSCSFRRNALHKEFLNSFMVPTHSISIFFYKFCNSIFPVSSIRFFQKIPALLFIYVICYKIIDKMKDQYFDTVYGQSIIQSIYSFYM